MKYSGFFYLALLSLVCANCTVNNEDTASSQDRERPLLFVPDDLEVTVWAQSPQFYNPTNMDVDARGRIWITEAVNYRNYRNTKEHLLHDAGDRVMILEDTDNDGVADSSKVFVQDKDLTAPLGIAVIGNKVYVSCSPSIFVYTDENGDGKPDKREVFLTGFGGKDHDHGLHSGMAGPDGKLYFNTGNQGPHIVTDKAGWTLRSGSVIIGGSPYALENTPGLKSDDGRVYTGGLAFRINPDGTGMEVLAHNFRNSYEVFVDSYGNLWQNDNDDQIATCRTTWVMERSNAGYLSNTGERKQQADRRPGQSLAIAQWHQEDPGILPAGDIYGSGSPTGVTVNEGDALGEKYRGLLLSADAGRNIIFGYMIEPTGAGYVLNEENRMSFISSVEKDNANYRWTKIEDDESKWFRPSDVTIGTDGAIYVADFYDPIVGGHQMRDKKGFGRIYRIAPKDRTLTAPVINLQTTEGQIQALLNPAPNVRNQGFALLKAAGDKVLEQVKQILQAENPYHRARAVWLLSQLGPAGVSETETLLNDDDPNIRITAFRALRQANEEKLLGYAERLASDKSPAVRREVAIALRDVPLKESQPIILALVEAYDGRDPWYLNALGIALEGQEADFYPALLKHFDARDPDEWAMPLANLVWELHPPAAVDALRQRIESEKLSAQEKKKAMVALGFIPSREAARAMQALAEHKDSDIADQATYWLRFRKTNDWRAFLKDWKAPAGLEPEPHPELLALRRTVENKKADIEKRMHAAAELTETRAGKLHLIQVAQSVPDTLLQAVSTAMLKTDDRYLKPAIEEYFKRSDASPPKVEDIAHLNGDVIKGKALMYGNCIVCHKMGDVGGEIGPVLTHIKSKYDKSSLISAILDPGAGIEFGSEPYLITMKDGGILYGILLSNGPVVTVLDIHGRRYMLEDADILSTKRLKNSPMPSPQHMKLGDQDIADITAFLME